MMSTENSLCDNITSLLRSFSGDYVHNIELEGAIFNLKIWTFAIYGIVTLLLLLLTVVYYSCYLNRTIEQLEYSLTKVLDFVELGSGEKEVPLEPDGVLTRYNGKHLTIQIIKNRIYNQCQNSLFIRTEYQEDKIEILPGSNRPISGSINLSYYRRHQFVDKLILTNSQNGTASAVLDTKVQLIKKYMPELKYQLRFYSKGTLEIQTTQTGVYLIGPEHVPWDKQIIVPGFGLPGGFRQVDSRVVLMDGNKKILQGVAIHLYISTHYLFLLPLNEKRTYGI